MAIAFVTGTSAAGLNGATTGAIDTTGASLLVVMVVAGAAVTVSDNNGNTWATLASQTITGQTGRLYYAWNPIVGAGHTFTVTGTASAASFEVGVFSGVQTSADPFDVQQSATATGVTQAGVGSGTLTPSQNNSLVIGGQSFSAAISAYAAQAGFATVAQVNFSGGSNYGSALEYLIQTTAAAIPNSTVIANWTGSASVTVHSAVFKPATGGGGGLTAGAVSQASATNTTINMASGEATGGTGPYTYQWYRSTTSGFAIGAGTLVSGATALTLADTSGAQGIPYFYRMRSTDSLSATADSAQVAGVLKQAPKAIGYAGDSISAGFGLPAGQSPPDRIIPLLSKMYGDRAVTSTNAAVSGSKTSEWVSGSANLIAAKSAFASAGVTLVHVMLGANDAAATNLVPAVTYGANLSNMCADLTGAGYVVMLSYPTYIPPGANSNATTSASVALAQQYMGQIDALINGSTILRGDVYAFNYFIAHLNEYQADMTHTLLTGSDSLAAMWARPIIENYIELPALTTRTVTVTLGDTNGAAANLTGLQVSFYDEPTPDLATTPRYQSAAETTNASGVLTFTAGSTLSVGGTGHLTVLGAAGVHFNGSVVVA